MRIVIGRCECECRCGLPERQCRCAPLPGSCSRAPSVPIMRRRWSRCPYGELRDPLWQLAVERSHLAEVSPLTGWPDTYSAGIVDAILGLRAARLDAEARAMQEARR